MKPRENPLDVAVARFVADFVAIIEGQVARALDEILAAAGARPRGARRQETTSEGATAKTRRGGKPGRTAAPAAKSGRPKASKVAKRGTEQLSLF